MKFESRENARTITYPLWEIHTSTITCDNILIHKMYMHGNLGSNIYEHVKYAYASVGSPCQVKKDHRKLST
jgi:hypothetical protein